MSISTDQAVILLGTSRSDGNTRAAVARVLADEKLEIIDLSQLMISPFDYQHKNETDSFLPLVERILAKSLWILATPVYWYTMSAQLKTFVDRLSDLVTVRKDLGRRLHGKSLAVLASGADESLPEGFESTFRLTAEYLDMEYIGVFYQQFGKDGKPVQPSTAQARAVGESWAK